jgi:phosphoribosylformimino-5-aminoimidazole carboxamide ribotide isomerase
MQLIPSIDLRGGRCVRLLKGDFAAETRYDVDPVQLALRYQALGARWLHVVDLDGARDGELANRELILRMLGVLSTLRVQTGGGVRSRSVVATLLAAGVARVVVGSAAVEAADEVRGWLCDFGNEAVCLAFDVSIASSGPNAGLPLLKTRGWREATSLSLWDAVAGYHDAGLRHVLCTDIALDGALQGPNTALYAEAIRRFPDIEWQASGGVSGGDDLAALAQAGAAAAISGKALLEDRFSTEELQPYLPGA